MKNSPPHALHVLYPIKKGSSSHPVVCDASDGRRYLVKLRGGQSSPYAAICDYLSCSIGAALGLPVVEPALVEISPETDIRVLDEEMRDLVGKSRGINLAYVFIENAGDATTEPGELPDRLFAFDCFLLNIDRTEKNLNLLEAGGEIRAFDYETAMLFMGILQGVHFGKSAMVLKQLRKNPLYRPDIDAGVFREMFARLSQLDPGKLCAYPASWSETAGEDHAELSERLVGGLQTVIADADACLDLYQRLTEVPLETEAERREVAEANRKAFEKRILGF